MHRTDIEEAMADMSIGIHGHFARALADAWYVADSTNRALIEKTWAHLIAKAIAFKS